MSSVAGHRVMIFTGLDSSHHRSRLDLALHHEVAHVHHYLADRRISEGQHALPRLVDEFDLPREVERVFASHHLGMIKPEIEIYQHVLAQLGVAPQRVLFLDDNQNNIDTALQLGIQSLQVKGFEALLAGLKNMGIKL